MNGYTSGIFKSFKNKHSEVVAPLVYSYYDQERLEWLPKIQAHIFENQDILSNSFDTDVQMCLNIMKERRIG